MFMTSSSTRYWFNSYSCHCFVLKKVTLRPFLCLRVITRTFSSKLQSRIATKTYNWTTLCGHLIIYFFLNIYFPTLHESNEGTIHRASNYPNLLPEMLRYCEYGDMSTVGRTRFYKVKQRLIKNFHFKFSPEATFLSLKVR